MRLLNTTSITLDYFQNTPPEYAILSHTWETEEVTLQDFTRDTDRSKAGWAKILKCCKLCNEEGWDYVWIDTCCIDKTSSADLSEAINSMFTWYQKAALCFAYLSDVETTHKKEQTAQLMKSRWFTRGWTLQELIAPAYLVFLDKNWLEIGTRACLSSAIEDVTGISPSNMANFRGCSVATKMSWASKRETTRIEDQAYCLMGLFDINMPLLYGEGEKAFLRLQYEILRASDDETIFAWRGPSQRGYLFSSNTSGMLAPSVQCFVKSALIERFQVDEDRSEFAMTNKGLGIDLQLWAFIGKEWDTGARPLQYIAPLNCKSKVDKDSLAVVLFHEGEGSFVREDPHELIIWGSQYTDSAFWEPLPRKRIYVRQVEEYSDLPKDTVASIYRLMLHRVPAINIRSLHDFRSGSQYTASTVLNWKEQPLKPIEYVANECYSFQVLIVFEVQVSTNSVELVLCISTFNNFLALSMFVRDNFPGFAGILEAAQADFKRATDTVSLVLPDQDITVTARLQPKSARHNPNGSDDEKPVQVSISWASGHDDADGPFAAGTMLSHLLSPEARVRLRDEEYRLRRKACPSQPLRSESTQLPAAQPPEDAPNSPTGRT